MISRTLSRWRFNAQDKHFVRFWGQLIYQAGLPHMLGNNSSRVQVALERSEADRRRLCELGSDNGPTPSKQAERS